MKKPFRKYLLCFLILLAIRGYAQQPFLRNISIGQGLPSSEIYRVMQDSKGYIWICSDGGVCRFNGRTFQCFTIADGLVDNTIFNIMEDSKGRIWFTGFNSKVGYYDRGKFYEIPANEQLQQKLSKGNYTAHHAALDKQDNLWLATARFMYKIPAAGGYSTVEIDKTCADHVFATFRLLDNNKALMSKHNPLLVNPLDKTSVSICAEGWPARFSYPILHHGHPRHDAVIRDSNTLVFSNSNQLFFLWRDGHYRIKEFPQSIIALYNDRLGNIWVGLSKGGVYFLKKGDTEAEPVHYLDNLSISCILIDSENGLWFSTLEKGIFYAPFKDVFSLNTEPGLSEKIAGISKVGNKVYVANYKSEFFSIDANAHIKKIPFNSNNITTTVDRVVFKPVGNNILISGGCLTDYDSLQKKFYNYTKEGYCVSVKEAVVIDQHTVLGIAYSTLATFKDREITDMIELPDRGTTMFKTAAGKIYIGTLSGLYTWENRVFSPVPALAGQRITDIAEDCSGRLLIATRGKGLFVLQHDRWTKIGEADGMASAICNSLLVENDTVWIATNKGISFFGLDQHNKVTGIKNIDITNGLPTNEVMSICRLNHYLYAGTRNGLCVIHEKGVYYNQEPPRLHINSILVNNKKIDPYLSCDFASHENNIKFGVDCLTYKSEFKSQYVYRLKGLKNDFVYSDRDTLEFLHLPPGHYQLEVYGINNNGVRSTVKTGFDFTIRKPFWLTWWFISICILFFLLLVYLFFLWRIRRIRKQEQIKNEMDRMVAEYQMIALRAQMNPHFIFNAINSIQNLILKEKSQQAYDYLTKFSKMVRKVLNYSTENMLTLEQEIEMLYLYTELEQLRFSYAFDFKVKIDPGIELSEVMVPGMLLQPFVENAIWHGILPLEGKRKGIIQVEVKLEQDQLKITIEDNGIGRERSAQINKSVSHKSLGLMLSDNRLKLAERLYGATGSKIQFQDLTDENGRPSGTRVILFVTYITAE